MCSGLPPAFHTPCPSAHHGQKNRETYLSSARKAEGSTSGSSISVDVVAIPPLNMASKTALPTASTNLIQERGCLSVSPSGPGQAESCHTCLQRPLATLVEAFQASDPSRRKDLEGVAVEGSMRAAPHSFMRVLALSSSHIPHSFLHPFPPPPLPQFSRPQEQARNLTLTRESRPDWGGGAASSVRGLRLGKCVSAGGTAGLGIETLGSCGGGGKQRAWAARTAPAGAAGAARLKSRSDLA